MSFNVINVCKYFDWLFTLKNFSLGYGSYSSPYTPNNYYSPATAYPGQTYGMHTYSN